MIKYELEEENVCFLWITTSANNPNIEKRLNRLADILSHPDGAEAIKWLNYVEENNRDFEIAQLIIESD